MANATTGQAAAVPLGNSEFPFKTQSLADLLAGARDGAREELLAAWRIEAERIPEQLLHSCRGPLERIFEERFAALGSRVEEQVRSIAAAAAGDAGIKARRDLSGRLSRALRRLRTFESEEDWSTAVVDATEGFSTRAALFAVNGSALRLRAWRGLASQMKMEDAPLESAAAFAAAIESRDAIVALRSSGELSEPIAAMLGAAPEERFYLFPITTGNRVAAVLYADSPGAEVDSGALELIGIFASSVLQAQARAPARSGLAAIGAAATPAPAIYLRAQRFARVQAAEMRLYHSRAVAEGRRNRDVYGALREQIDNARDAFRRDFLSASPTMADYLHLELLRTLANDNVQLLGPEYPGAMA